jgi:hypothetical protein
MHESEELGEAERSPEQIEREIEDTRTALEATVDELGERLRPGTVAEEAGAYVRAKAARSAGEAWRSLIHVARENPVPLALLGGGFGALLAIRIAPDGLVAPVRHGLRLGTRRKQRFLDLPRTESLRAWAAPAAERAGEVGAQATGRALAAATRLRKSELGVRTVRQVERARSGLEEQAAALPLLLGMASFVVGAWLAARR